MTLTFQIINFYFGHLSELLTQPQERRGGQGTAANPCLAAVPCPPAPAVEPRDLS